VHWADVIAEQLSVNEKKCVLATAITPSGSIHVGNLREILTTDAVYRALCDKKIKAELIYIADTFDPLRKVYPFLPSCYGKYIGMPLSEIPCPCEKHDNYASHFLKPFLTNLKKIGVKPRVYLAHKLYYEGVYNDAIKIALDNANKIRAIMKNVAGRPLPDNWMPFNVKCKNCNKLDGEIRKYKYPTLVYACKSCGNKGTVDLRDGGIGKLPWRIDWPARWKILNVSFEAFGKDHAAAGGSWDTGKEISISVYDHKPPMPFVYEFIHLKGKGAMHSSTGTAISADEVLMMTPPEVLRFLIMKYDPSRHIEFDSGFGLLDLVDEYDRYERVFFDKEKETAGTKESKRVYLLSQPYPKKIVQKCSAQIPYRHLVTLVQIAKNNKDVIQILKRNREIDELSEIEEKKLKERIKKVRYWIKNYAPEIVKFELQKIPPDIQLTPERKRGLSLLKTGLQRVEWNPENIHKEIHLVAEQWEKEGMRNSVKEIFSVIYLILLGTKKGPRAGYFIHSLGKNFVLQRIDVFI
jgi:lysyl-tRNA synthetase class 1